MNSFFSFRYSSLAAAIFLFASNYGFSQMNEHTKLQYSKLELPSVDYTPIFKLLETEVDPPATIPDEMTKACYQKIIDDIISHIRKEEVGYADFYIESSWIKELWFFEIKPTGLTVAVMKTGSQSYVFKMDISTFSLWVKSSSKGRFYNQFIRDNPKFSFKPYCD